MKKPHLRKWLKALDLDERDAFLFIGLAAFGAGMYGVDWRLAAGAIGLILIYLGLFHRSKGTD